MARVPYVGSIDAPSCTGNVNLLKLTQRQPCCPLVGISATTVVVRVLAEERPPRRYTACVISRSPHAKRANERTAASASCSFTCRFRRWGRSRMACVSATARAVSKHKKSKLSPTAVPPFLQSPAPITFVRSSFEEHAPRNRLSLQRRLVPRLSDDELAQLVADWLDAQTTI
jgi:hypothetical protein